MSAEANTGPVVEFRGVSYRPPQTATDVIANLNLEIFRGEPYSSFPWIDSLVN